LGANRLLNKRAAAKASSFLNEYSLEKGIYMKNNYFNADHTHALIDLPPVFRLKKSSSFLKVDLLTGLITIE